MQVWRYGDNIDTDMLFPGKYVYTYSTPDEIIPHLLEDLDSSFSKKVREGDIIIAGKNFGCGSAREYAPIAIKYAGISAVIAKSFGRIFFRNAVNIGLPPLVFGDSQKIHEGDVISVNLKEGGILNETSRESYGFEALPDFLYEILESGGLIEFGRVQLKKDKEA